MAAMHAAGVPVVFRPEGQRRRGTPVVERLKEEKGGERVDEKG